jgi:hypothetical protein
MSLVLLGLRFVRADLPAELLRATSSLRHVHPAADLRPDRHLLRPVNWKFDWHTFLDRTGQAMVRLDVAGRIAPKSTSAVRPRPNH